MPAARADRPIGPQLAVCRRSVGWADEVSHGGRVERGAGGGADRVAGERAGRRAERPAAFAEGGPVVVGHVVGADHHGEHVGAGCGVAVGAQDADAFV